jgi:hypothetical protein
MENINSSLDYDSAITEIGCAVLEVNETDGDHMELGDIIVQVVDGCQYAIYTKYHADVLNFSPNADYALEEGLLDVDSRSTSAQILSVLAFWALSADVHEWVESYLQAVDDGRIDLDEE